MKHIQDELFRECAKWKTEAERLRRERDSLIEDLKDTGKACRVCKYFGIPYGKPPCDICKHTRYKYWEYRGPREARDEQS